MERRSTIDTRTFERLVAAHHEEVWRSARRVLRSDADAFDAVQELFLRVLDGRLVLDEHGDPGRTLRWWAVRIALNERRGVRRRSAREADAAAAATTTTEGAMDERLEDADRRALWDQVEAMPDELRVPVVLRFAEGLGFARIAEALGVAESTAHERVRKGLDHLRGALKGAGLAGLAVGVESSLASGAPSAVPAGVSERLMELASAPVAVGGASASGFGAAAWGAISALVVGLSVVLAVVLSGAGDASGPEFEVASVDPAANASAAAAIGLVDEEVRDARAAVDAAVGETPDDGAAQPTLVESLAAAGYAIVPDARRDDGGRTVTVRGRVVDEDGLPLADEEVWAEAAQKRGKGQDDRESGRTDADGRFEIRLEGVVGDHFFATPRADGRGNERSAVRRVGANGVVELGDLRAILPADLRLGPHSAEVTVVDPTGAPVVGAIVELCSNAERTAGAEVTWRGWVRPGTERFEFVEASGVTDAAGFVRLDGAYLGDASVLVQAPDASRLASARHTFVARSGGVVEHRFVLEEAGSIRGRLRVDGAEMTAELARSLRARTNDALTGAWVQATIDDDGAFTLDGLPALEHRVHFGNAWTVSTTQRVSNGFVDAVPGGADLDVLLKRASDPRDRGVHAAEVHGRVVRSEDGEPVPVEDWDLTVQRWALPDGYDLERDVLPNWLFPRPVQRMAGDGEPPSGGAFHRTGLQAGPNFVQSLVDDRAAHLVGPIVLGEREIVTDLVVELEPAATLLGRLEGPTGEAVDGAYVFVTGVGPYSDAQVAEWDRQYRWSGGRGTFWTNGSGRRSQDARFELTRLPSTFDLRIVALHPDFEPAIGPVVRMESGATREGMVLRFAARRRE